MRGVDGRIVDIIKDGNDAIVQEAYITYKLHRVLVPDVTHAEAQLAAEEDWARTQTG